MDIATSMNMLGLCTTFIH